MSGKLNSNKTGQRLEPTVDLERRRLTALAALTLLGGAAITLTDCGGSGSPTAPFVPPPTTLPPPAAPTCPTGAVCGPASGDPDHLAVITSAELAAGGALVVNIMGIASHNHTVSLSASDVVAIRGGTRVVKTSSTTLSHEHVVTFN